MTAAPSPFVISGKRIWVTGHRGMVGSAICRRLARESCEVLTAGRDVVDLRRQDAVEKWLDQTRPDAIIVAAAKVGGIHANSTLPAEFLYDNLAIETNLIHGAHRIGVSKLLFLGSSCIYPKLAPQPITEDALLTGPLEPTNEWYAIAKIAGIKLCQAYRAQYGDDYISGMPTNLYGQNDNFDPLGSHVLPALMRRLHEAKEQNLPVVTLWGTGTPLREFLHVDDLADASIHLLANYSGALPINIGSSREITIAELAALVGRVIGYQGRFEQDTSKPDGTPRKLMDSSRLAALGWTPKISLEDGIAQTYRWYLDNLSTIRR
jgi:GDP-L-fucose synthase